MPEVEEVFRLATNKVKPDPNALERQARRQRASARTNRVWAYVAVAAVVVLAAVAAVVFAGTRDDVVPGGPSGVSSQTATLPPGATAQTTELVNLAGDRVSTVEGLPLDAWGLSATTDGSTIAFVTTPEGTHDDQVATIWTGGFGVRVLATPGLNVSSGGTAISPDGTRVAFGATADGNTDIYVMGTDGSGLTRLTNDPATDQYPQWSSDGRTIVYDNAGALEDTSDPQFSSTAEIWTVPDIGGSPTQITHNGVNDASPAFSPDGARIVYTHAGDVWTIRADGSDPRVLVSQAGGFTPRWSPDGKRIAYTIFDSAYRPQVARSGSFGDLPLVTLVVVDVATGASTNLPTIAMASDYNTPVWLPGNQLLIRSVPSTDPNA